MTKIPVVIVDDEWLDRMLARRQLEKAEEFGVIEDAETGDTFLEKFFNGTFTIETGGMPLLVLMDINMPGRNGFATIEEMNKRIANNLGPESVAVLMFTSSQNPDDQARAQSLPLVKGYINKPLDTEAVAAILDMYRG